MKKILFGMLTLFTIFIVLFIDVKPSHAKSLWQKPVITSEDQNIKVSVDKKTLTNGPVVVTIDSSKYKNGTNVIYSWEHDKQVANSIAKFTIKKNGEYMFAVSDKNSDYDYDASDYTIWGEKWVTVTIDNIDNQKPSIKFANSFINEIGQKTIVVDVTDNLQIKKVKLPNGKYETYDDGQGALVYYEVYKNGNYKFTAEDVAGNKKELTVKVTDYKKVPLSINKITNKTKTITGKTLANAKVYFYVGNQWQPTAAVKADKKGNYKIKLKKTIKAGTKVEVISFDSKEKYVMNRKTVKVSKSKK